MRNLPEIEESRKPRTIQTFDEIVGELEKLLSNPPYRLNASKDMLASDYDHIDRAYRYSFQDWAHNISTQVARIDGRIAFMVQMEQAEELARARRKAFPILVAAVNEISSRAHQL